MNANKSRSGNPRPESQRKRMERLLKEMLAGRESIHTVAEMLSKMSLPRVTYRRVIE